MTELEKLQYLGLAQALRKGALKAEQAWKRARWQPPRLPRPVEGIRLKIDFLGQRFDLSDPQRWHRSPDTGRLWPMAYAGAIPLDAAGDVKLIWELNRHQFLPAVAARDPELARFLLQDWIAQNPYEFGIHWNSAMEVGLRLIAWDEAFDVVPALRREFVAAYDQHARFLRHHLSSDWIPRSNHLVGEAAALTVHDDGRRHRWLVQAAREQFYGSGVNREQSVAYHHFVTHLFHRAGFPQAKALEYLGGIRQPDGSLPNIGDNDDGRASTWLMELPEASAESVAFPDAGHYVLRQRGNYCFVRCGEFGLPPNFAHAHADLLSPILWLQGAPIFVDPGTYTYNGDAALRQKYRSAQSHNVLTIDDRNQAEPTGTFSWGQPPQAVCETWNGTMFVGRIGAWQRTIQMVGDGFVIRDRVECRERATLRWRFHLAPGLKVVNLADGIFSIGDQFSLRVQHPVEARLSVGEGWFSPSYGQQIAIQTCDVFLTTDKPVALEFTIQ